jgi:hypothetical protein
MTTPAAGAASRAFTIVAASLAVAGFAAPAALGAPGIPQAPVALFSEDFESVPGSAAVLIEGYLGATSQHDYNADTSWEGSKANCNGVIASFAGDAAGCTPAGGDANLKLLARKLGAFAAAPAPDANHAVGENTDADPDPGNGDIEIRITEGVEAPEAPGHFLVAGTDVAVLDCQVGAPLLSFVLSDTSVGPSVDYPLSPEPQDVCVQGGDLGDGMRGGRIYSDASVLADFAALGLDVHNANNGANSYHGLDNLVVADGTPQLDQSFASATATTGATADLTFTITNTTDLASKQGWSFSGDLPAGLTVASGAAVGLPRSTSCPATTVTAPVGGQSVAASGGLAADQASCTVTVSVRSAGAGSYSVPGAGFARVGLRAPGSASVTFADPIVTPPPPPPPPPPPAGAPAACADGADNDGDGLIDAKDPGCVLAGVYTPQKDSEASIAAIAQCAKGALQLTDVFGRRGRTLLRGVAGPDAVGKKVAIFSTWDEDKQVATATVQGDLTFTTTAPLPPRDIRETNAARFQARLGTKRSLNLKFSRRMTETVASRVAATRVKIGGRVTKPLAVPRATVLVRAARSCQSEQRFRGVVVARGVKVASSGTWSASITLPKALRGEKVYLRAQTRVRQTTRSARTFATYTLIQGVALK